MSIKMFDLLDFCGAPRRPRKPHRAAHSKFSLVIDMLTNLPVDRQNIGASSGRGGGDPRPRPRPLDTGPLAWDSPPGAPDPRVLCREWVARHAGMAHTKGCQHQAPTLRTRPPPTGPKYNRIIRRTHRRVGLSALLSLSKLRS